MAVTLKQTEATPESWPEIRSPYLEAYDKQENIYGRDHAYAVDWIWQRIESYIAHRFVARSVVWEVEGQGEWKPPLTPVSNLTAERWGRISYAPCELVIGPRGYMLEDGDYRISATVGGGEVPPAVDAAAVRLVEYCCLYAPNKDGPQKWATSLTQKGEGENPSETSFTRPANWVAKALINSGAADLLRPYRRV